MEKTYVFDTNAGGSFDHTALLASMFGNRGVDPNLVAMMNVVIHKASSIGEFINTFEHEKNHLEMHICEALDINPYSEKAAHMSGDLAQLILEEALYSIAEL